MGNCASSNFPVKMPKERQYRRAIKLYEVAEVRTLTNAFNRNKCFETGELPLTLAASQGHEAVVQALIVGGADVNRLDQNGRGPLHLAVYINDEETVDILLQEKTINVNKYDGNDMTPLHIACERGCKSIVAKLLKAGANPNESMLGILPLIHSIIQGHSDCTELLLQHGANPNVTDSRGNTALYIAVSNSDVLNVQHLLKYGANIHAQNRDPETLTCLAALNGSVGVLKALFDHGCDPNVYKEDDVPPLISAAARGNCDSIEFLVRYGAHLEGMDRRGTTALFISVMGVVDVEKEVFYSKYFSNVYRNFAKYDPMEINPESATKCAMSMVQGGANLTKTWERFATVFPYTQGVTFEQMVLCEVLIQAFGFASIPHNKIRTFAVNLLTLREYGLIKLLYSAGVDPEPEDLYVLSVRSEEMDRQIFKWVKRLRFKPRQLKDLCRKKIRNHISWNILYLVEKLEIPQDVKEYICIMDTEHYSKVDEE